MIDLHCHILPGVDDGAQTFEDSIQMAKLAVEEGITHILATPHHQKRSWINAKADVIMKVSELQSKLDARNIDLTIFPGQEVSLYGELIKDIDKDEILFTDESQTYVMIEFPTVSIPTYAERLFYELQLNGKTPVIVHPERNHQILEHPNRLKDFIDKGALAQLTAASYTGGFGKKTQKVSRQLIEANLVHFISSDAHNTGNRAFHMNEAYDLLTKEYGRSMSNAFHQTTKDLINGDPVITLETYQVKKTFSTKWFK
ncbi:tyrosine-protein phosphatase [Alkalibacterium pelagium]|uniref:Tyrosine-protein phosphatase n=1 Tax=Alkalibacterium pelagium TaxID=426702 RepID=A0A1H7NNP2_9LACT|nr:CpsB/CapC family capsule biosynthesis tyrosine phosphatase [Alkalibacterium pelagium]GEN51423.1 tyrosine protein phosphatase [Alkalibacterium pelagium]SEL25001.1 protein-tyrosine phosphatase [Alkalibacterium pelagium]